jgi:hypothetical protein
MCYGSGAAALTAIIAQIAAWKAEAVTNSQKVGEVR